MTTTSPFESVGMRSFHPFLEEGGVDRTIVGLRRYEPAKAYAGDERDRLVVPCGTPMRNRRPRRQRPPLRAKLVEAPVRR